MAVNLNTQQGRAAELFAAKQYSDALAVYTVLRKSRATNEGRDSTMYLSNLHSSIYCLVYLNRWPEAGPLAEELSTTRDRVLGLSDAASIDAKRWWVWISTKVGSYQRAADLQIQLADAYFAAGQSEDAEKALATAVFYQSKVGSQGVQEDEVIQIVADRASGSANGQRLVAITKKVGPKVFVAGVTAAFEGVVGGLFN